MSTSLGSLAIYLTANTGNLLSGLKRGEAALATFGKSAQRIGGSLSTYVTAPLVGIGGLAVKNFMEAEAAGARLQAVLKATGNASGLSLEQMQAHASELQKITTFDDDAVAGAQALLATFTKIKGDNFKLATASALDMATVLETDVKSAAQQLGKALNDPAKGMALLARAGVRVSAEQEKQIKHLVETGNTHGAQLVMLAELQKRFGGAAAAAANTAGGRWKQAVNQMGNATEEIGERLVPAVNALAIAAKDGVEWWDGLDAAQRESVISTGMYAAATGPAIKGIGLTLSGIGGLIGGVRTAKTEFIKMSQSLMPPLDGLTKTQNAMRGVKGALGVVAAAGVTAFVGWEIGKIIGEWWELDKKILSVGEHLGIFQKEKTTEQVQGRAVAMQAKQTERADISDEERARAMAIQDVAKTNGAAVLYTEQGKNLVDTKAVEILKDIRSELKKAPKQQQQIRIK